MKKIIFGLALVLSLGLLASCSNTYTVDNVNYYRTSKIACNATGTITTTVTNEAAQTVKVIKTDLLDGTFGNTSLSYQQCENSNATDYWLRAIKYSKITKSVNNVEVGSVEGPGAIAFPWSSETFNFKTIGDKAYFTIDGWKNGLADEDTEFKFTQNDGVYTLKAKFEYTDADEVTVTVFDITLTAK